MGGKPTDGPYPGEFPPQGGDKDFRDATMEMDGMELDITPSGKFHAGGGAGKNETHISI